MKWIIKKLELYLSRYENKGDFYYIKGDYSKANKMYRNADYLVIVISVLKAENKNES